MTEINGVWIFDSDGSLIFSSEIYKQGSESYDAALFSGLILSIQQFIMEIGEKKAERIEMGDAKYFISKDPDTNIIFVIRGIPTVDNSKASKLVAKIQKRFNQKFKKFLNKFTTKELRIYIDDIFQNELQELLKDSDLVAKERFSEFFESL